MKLIKNDIKIGSEEIENYENGTLSFEKKVDLLQRLIDSGMLWRFCSEYSREASNLIDRGYLYER